MRIVGLDRDPAALEAARQRLSGFGDRVTLIAAPFSTLESVLSRPGFEPLAGVLLDLGVSSPQLDWSERGFSFREDGPLDMRMDPTTGPTAADLVNTLPVEDLAALFRENGEGRLSGRIARAVVKARPLTSTRQLAEVVASAVPAPARRKGHPARRVFQALRIQVNDELGQLEAALPAALSHLEVGGVCAVISYHSGEDRLTKQVFADAATGGMCLSSRPAVCLRCGRASSTRLPRRAEGIGIGDRRQPPLRERPPACHRADRAGSRIRRVERPDGASSRSHRSRHPPTRRCGVSRLAPPCWPWRRSSFDPARPAPGRPDSQPARHSRGPHRCGSGKAPPHRVRLHGGGRVAGRRRGAGAAGQRPGEPLEPCSKSSPWSRAPTAKPSRPSPSWRLRRGLWRPPHDRAWS